MAGWGGYNSGGSSGTCYNRGPNSESMEELQQQYKKENKRLGAGCAGVVMNAPKMLTPALPVAAAHVFKCASQIHDARKKRDTIEEQAFKHGVDIHDGPRKRDIVKGAVKGVHDNI